MAVYHGNGQQYTFLDIVVSRKGIPLATNVYRRAAHTGHSFSFHSVYPMSKKGESFSAYIVEILSYDKNIRTC